MHVIISLFLLTVFLGVGAWDATGVWAQGRQEPRIEGVGYSELAQWQATYGGGAFYGQVGPPGYGAHCPQPFPVLYAPVRRDVKKARKGKKTRK